MLIPDRMNSLSDHARCAELLADAPGSRMPLVAIVDYSAIEKGLNPDGPQLVSIAGVDRVVIWDGLDDAGFAAAVVQREITTAATMRHHLNTPDGALCGFAPEPPKGLPTLGSERGVATTLPGLWLALAHGGAGGFTGAMLTGMLAARAAMKSRHGCGGLVTTGT
jgi:all-trans-retinol 13,14-reductase